MAHHLATGCKFNFELHQPTKCVFTILSEPLSAARSRNLPINIFITLGPFPPTQVMTPTTIFLHFLTFLHYSSILLFVWDVKTSQKTCCVFGGWVVESNLFFNKRLVFWKAKCQPFWNCLSWEKILTGYLCSVTPSTQGIHEVSVPWLYLGCVLTLVNTLNAGHLWGRRPLALPWMCAYFGDTLNEGRSWSKRPLPLPWRRTCFGIALNAGRSWSKHPLALPWMCAYFGNTLLLRCYPTHCWLCGNILLANTKDFSFSFIFSDILFPLFYFTFGVTFQSWQKYFFNQ